MLLWLFTSQLTYGSLTYTITTAIMSEIRQSMTLSPMSLAMTPLRWEPSRRRMAISRMRNVL